VAEFTNEDIERAERLACVEYTASEREQIRESIDELHSIVKVLRDQSLENDLHPATTFDAALMVPADAPPPGARGDTIPQTPARFDGDPPESPSTEEDLAYAPVSHQADWLRRGRISSLELTEVYLKRLKASEDELNAVVTLMEDEAREQAEQADRELSHGVYRGPLHGIPWGAKDLFDTAGVPTTWGAEPYLERKPSRDAYVVRSLKNAGAVLAAKLSLGALAYGDIWHKGRTNNPWNTEEGSSGSSAGSAAAVAAGLVGFALGTETMGSILSPSHRCGVSGLRPSFGRVPRTGAMSLCWSFDKIGPMCRTVDDTAIVFKHLLGTDLGDPDARGGSFHYERRSDLSGIRVGYREEWFDAEDAPGGRDALSHLRESGADLVEVELPKLPYHVMRILIYAEAAAAFEDLTASNGDDTLRRQDKEAWPNLFRMSRFISAIDYIQAQRIRRRIGAELSRLFRHVDVVISPETNIDLLLGTNGSGHPALSLRAGYRENGRPYNVDLWAGHEQEAILCVVGHYLERHLAVWAGRPQLSSV
jgi:Asp-tRNA(Asn)/Glu-tRNA(Gln) amidotransferase A subunit family amidase